MVELALAIGSLLVTGAGLGGLAAAERRGRARQVAAQAAQQPDAGQQAPVVVGQVKAPPAAVGGAGQAGGAAQKGPNLGIGGAIGGGIAAAAGADQNAQEVAAVGGAVALGVAAGVGLVAAAPVVVGAVVIAGVVQAVDEEQRTQGGHAQENARSYYGQQLNEARLVSQQAWAQRQAELDAANAQRYREHMAKPHGGFGALDDDAHLKWALDGGLICGDVGRSVNASYGAGTLWWNLKLYDYRTKTADPVLVVDPATEAALQQQQVKQVQQAAKDEAKVNKDAAAQAHVQRGGKADV